MHKFSIEVEIKTEHKNCCNGCKLLNDNHNVGYCKPFKTPLRGKWETCAGSDYYEFIRPEICKQNDKEKTK